MAPWQWWRWGIVAMVGLGVGSPAVAQTFPPCPPPSSSEFLLLAQGRTEAERNQVQATLPTTTSVMVCQYLEDTVVRAGGFTSLENANAWAQYLTEVQGVPTFVVRPATPGDATIPAPPQTPTPVAYLPQVLEAGYAVLVEYDNDPAIATTLESTLGSGVGLAVYREKPYLLATYSRDLRTAAATLQQVSTTDLTAFVVDSREVILLAPAVVTTP